MRHSASPVVRDATPTPGGTRANYPQTVQGDWRAVRPTFRRSSLATQSLPYAISAQVGGAYPGCTRAVPQCPLCGRLHRLSSVARGPSRFRDDLRARPTSMFAAAKRAMPVIVPKFRAHKVSAAWRVPTLAQARLPVACHNPNKESFSRDQLRFQKSAAQGRDHSGAASTSAKPPESIDAIRGSFSKDSAEKAAHSR